MGKFFASKTKKEQIVPDYLAAENLITVKNDKKKELEKLVSDISELSFISTSPITGEIVDVVRTEDVYEVIKEFLGMYDEE